MLVDLSETKSWTVEDSVEDGTPETYSKRKMYLRTRERRREGIT